jgi:hypothetical protein
MASSYGLYLLVPSSTGTWQTVCRQNVGKILGKLWVARPQLKLDYRVARINFPSQNLSNAGYIYYNQRQGQSNQISILIFQYLGGDEDES